MRPVLGPLDVPLPWVDPPDPLPPEPPLPPPLPLPPVCWGPLERLAGYVCSTELETPTAVTNAAAALQ
jgi:hypothetical protein